MASKKSRGSRNPVSQQKAERLLKDGKAHGVKLTQAQVRFFRAAVDAAKRRRGEQ